MSMSGTEMTETTFSDFEHENVCIEWNSNTGDFERGVAADWNPFDNRGGLDSDEIAELVALQVQGQAQTDGDGSGDDNIIANVEIKGGLGFNIDYGDLACAPPTNLAGGAFPSEEANEVLQEDALDEDGDAGSAGSVKVGQTDETGLIYPFAVGFSASSGYDSYPILNDVVNYRELYGRGPVIDATDDWSLRLYHVQNGTEVAGELALNIRPVWDVSTVEGVRSRFSLPRRTE